MSCLISDNIKAKKIVIPRCSAEEDFKYFIDGLKEDLEILKGESFQRHDPDYYDEVSYYNNFHRLIPQSLLLSDCYLAFVTAYREQGKSLYEAVSAFLEEYKKMVYTEKQIGTATTVDELIKLLSEQPLRATVDVAASCHMSDVEVWYDKGINTIILK